MLKNIIFDLSEVIISGYHGVENLIEKRYGIKAEDFIKRKQETLSMFLDAMRGMYTEEEYLEELIDGQGWNVTVGNIKEVIRENLNIPVYGTLEVIKKLKGKYKLILLSDHMREWAEYILENNTDLKLFDESFFSYNLKQLKQDNNTFKFIVDKLGINANETVFIDDYSVNIETAKKQGIDGILFINAKQLEDELRKKYNVILEK